MATLERKWALLPAQSVESVRCNRTIDGALVVEDKTGGYWGPLVVHDVTIPPRRIIEPW